MVFKYLWFAALVMTCQCASAPFIKPCKAADNECIAASAQAALPYVAPGIPELGVKSLDPMRLDYVKADQAGLVLIIKDTTVNGMKGCKIEGVKDDVTKHKFTLIIKCTVKLVGDYKLDGNILLLPVRGEGKYDFDIRDIVIKTVNDYETVIGEDGKEHRHVKAWKHSFLTKGGAHFNFNNLFNGNKVLAGPVTEFVNSNWAEVMKEVAAPIVYAIVENVVEGVEQFYKAFPTEDLILA